MNPARTRHPALLAALVLGITIPQAGAQDNAGFLGAFTGSWRGAGEARLDLKGEPTRVNCRVSAEFEPSKVILNNTGRCGTTKGTRNVNGYIRERNGSLFGDFLGALKPEEIMRQKIRVEGEQLVAETTIEQKGRMVRVRTLLSHPENDSFGVRTEVFDHATRKWESAAELRFERQ